MAGAQMGEAFCFNAAMCSTASARWAALRSASNNLFERMTDAEKNPVARRVDSSMKDSTLKPMHRTRMQLRVLSEYITDLESIVASCGRAGSAGAE